MMNITKPTLLLNEDICRANIRRMVTKAEEHNLTFKPHMKTHQAAVIGEWLQSNGVKAITVSSVSMATYFADHGWSDITIAFPCNLREIEVINALAEKISLTLLVNSVATGEALQKDLTSAVDIYIELDTGSKRTGLTLSDISRIKQLIAFFQSSDLLHWKGFYSHPGHSYGARSPKEIRDIHQSVLKKVNTLRASFTASFEVCIGDTPCCSAGTDFEGIDAISPGNFIFYDLMQLQIGSCDISDIATAVICPVVDRYSERNQIAIYGGAIHFSKESLQTEAGTHYGWVAVSDGDHWTIPDKETYLIRLSQEHGIVQCSPETFDQFAIGDSLTILPVHSCLTAHLLGRFRLLESGDEIIQMQN